MRTFSATSGVTGAMFCSYDVIALIFGNAASVSGQVSRCLPGPLCLLALAGLLALAAGSIPCLTSARLTGSVFK